MGRFTRPLGITRPLPDITPTRLRPTLSRGPLKGDMSAQKALQGSKTETRELLGGTTENSVS